VSEPWDAFDLLVSAVVDRLASWAGLEIVRQEARLLARLTPHAGVRSFFTLTPHDESVFMSLFKAEFSTLVGSADPDSEDTVRFVDEANATTIAGTWEVFANGDLGVTGQLVFTDPVEAALADQVIELWRLQIEDAVSLELPSGVEPFEDLAAPTPPPPLRLSAPYPVDLEGVVERLWWRSGHQPMERFVLDTLTDEVATLRAPALLTEPLRNAEGELRGELRRVTLALTDHPRRGAGIMVQVGLLPDLVDEAIAHRNCYLATQHARWFGAGLGGMMAWADEATTTRVYRAFLPLDSLNIVGGDAAVDLIVDTVLGAVNIAGVAEAFYDMAANVEHPELVERAIEQRRREMLRSYRVAAARAATRPLCRPDGLADTDGPVVQVGEAVLDRLAMDQLQIGTAPWTLEDDGFSWLPGPFVQTVTASRMLPSRNHEITDVAIRTDLGRVPAELFGAAREVCVGLADELTLCAPVLDDDGRLQLVASFILHEGVWWHRSELLARAAPLQLHAADKLAAQLAAHGIRTDVTSAIRTVLGEREDPASRDGIYEVIPDLVGSDLTRGFSAADLAAIASSRLLSEPYSRLFGDLNDDPDVVVAAHDVADDGGWDPLIGEVLIMFETFRHDFAGETLRVTVNPGYPPGDGDLDEAATWLTRFTQRNGRISFTPSWRPLGRTVGPTVVLPIVAVERGLDNGAEIVLQAVRSCVCALVRATAASPLVFPGFDRSQLNLARSEGNYDDWPGNSSVRVWASLVNNRALAVPVPGTATPPRWVTSHLDLEGSLALADWLTGTDNALSFAHRSSDLVAERRAQEGITLEVGAAQFHLDEQQARALAWQLAHPEAHAAAAVPGPFTIYGLGTVRDDDGSTTVILPPAGGLLAALDAPDVRIEGLSALTEDTVWLRVASEAGSFDLDTPETVLRWILDAEDDSEHLHFHLAFPQVDPRVTALPPPPLAVSVSRAEIAAALRHFEAGQS